MQVNVHVAVLEGQYSTYMYIYGIVAAKKRDLMHVFSIIHFKIIYTAILTH